MFSIDEFNASVNRSGGLAQRSQYVAVIIPPSAIAASETGIGVEHMALRIDSFEYPSRSIVPIEYRDYGPPRPIGGQANFTESGATVLMSSDFREREFFMRWQDLVVGHHRDINQDTDTVGSQFDVGYFDDYRSAAVEIRQYNQTSQNIEDYVYRVGLVDVYPSLVGNMDASWDGGDDVHRMNVTFSYRYFVEDFRLLPGAERRPRTFFNEFFNTDFGRTVAVDLEPQQRRTLTFFEAIQRG